MQVIMILIALAIIGVLLVKQIGPSDASSEATSSRQSGGPPQVPVKPEQLESFSNDMEAFLQEAADKRADAADPQE